MTKKPKLSEHVRQRTKEWFRKAEHELKFLEHAPFDVEDPPTDTACRLAHTAAEYSLKGDLMLNKKKIKKAAIEKARRIKNFVMQKAEELGY